MSSNDFFMVVYDENGAPLTGLAAGVTWPLYIDADDEQAQTPPTVTEPGSAGLYKVTRDAAEGKRRVGILDFGATAYPRYFMYDSKQEDVVMYGLDAKLNTLKADVAVVAGLVHKNARIDNTTFNANKVLTSARIRIYPTPEDATNDTNVLKVFTWTAVPNMADPSIWDSAIQIEEIPN